jgi:hypothetical protein
MAHEWFHAVDNFAAGGGVHNYATERRDHPRAFAILQAIKKTAYYTRSQNLAKFKGDYWTEGRELTARAFEGVCAVMLNAAGICSDFLVNCKSMDEFTAEDVARRSDCYPYPTADEAAALLPLYIVFLKEVFGDVLTAPAECYEEAKRAAARAEEERKEAERIAAERAEAERQERERKAKERAEQAAREAEEMRQRAAHAVGLLRDVLTARHLDTIATAYDSATAYAVGHLEGEIYTISADIKTANEQGRAYIESRPAAVIQYKRAHNAKRIICRRWQVAEIRANKWNARELCEALTMTDARDIVRTFATYEKADTWRKAAELWEATQRDKAERAKRAAATLQEAADITAPATVPAAIAEGATGKADTCEANSDRETGAPAAGLHLEDTTDGVRVIGDDWKDTYFNKKAIKANGAHWNKEAKQWEATDPADVARLRAWFALRNEEQAAPAAEAHTESTESTETPAAATLETPAEISESREFADGVRVIVSGYERAKYGKECGTVNGYDPATGKYWVIFRSDHGDGNSWHTADELEHLPEWVTEGAQVYNLKGWHTGEPFTISNARAEVVTMTTANGFKFECDPVDLVNEYTPRYRDGEKSETAQTTKQPDDQTTNPATALPEWLTVGARVRTRGRYMMTTRSRRPEWVEGEEMTVRAISADLVELESRTESGTLKSLETISTATAAADLTPVYSASEKSETPAEPLAVAASYDTDETESESKEPAATYETTATAAEQQEADALPFMEKAAILDKVTARIYAPWGNVSNMWLCPFRGANDVWNAWARRYNFRDCGRLADWALTAKVGERAEYRGLMVQIWERDGQTAADPESEADRLKANRETRERLRAAIVAELEAVGAYLYPFDNEMKVFGKVETVADIYKVEDIARRYSSAKFIHEDRAALFEFDFPLFFPHFFPTDPAPEPSGDGAK